jgi:wyosine [tRNA(Phe)-imidazoG37] synthetase (radical SAM superfamily)
MKKPNFDIKKKPYVNSKNRNVTVVEDFSIEKLNQFPEDMIEIFKLIQAVRYDRINLQEEYNGYRLKLNNDRMELESEVIKLKKQYNTKISALQEEYNSVKSNNTIELAKIREG